MRVIMYLLIENAVIFIINVIYMNRITKEVYHNLERFANFKGLSDEFIEFTTKPINYCGIDTYQNEACNNFLNWVDEKANNWAELDRNLPVGMNECYQFGMTWGCRPDCPAFIRGECDIKEDNIEEWKQSGEYDYELEELGLL